MKYGLLVIALLLCGIGHPQPAMGVKDCLEHARENNPQWTIGTLQIETARLERKELRAGLYPQISGSFDNTYNGVLRTSVLPGEAFGGAEGTTTEVQFGTPYESVVNLRASQRLYDPALGATNKIANRTIDLREIEQQQTADEVAYQVAGYYYRILLERNRRENLNANLITLRELLLQGKLQLEEGVARAVDVDRLRVNANALRVQIEQAELTIQQLESALKLQMGMHPATPFQIVDLELETLYQQFNTVTKPPRSDSSQRPDMLLLDVQTDINSLQKKRNNQGYLPSLTLNLQAGTLTNRSQLSYENAIWNDFLGLTLSLEVPIFDGFRKQAINQQWKNEAAILEQRRIQTRLRATYDIEDAARQVRIAENNLAQRVSDRELAAKVFEITQLEFEEGITNTVSLTEARNDLTEAENVYAQTLLEFLLARLELAYARGTIIDFINQQ